MAPYHFSGTTGLLVTLLIGFCFGFVLEKAGFGNARNLSAQFYLYDMRVLKVMFTGIVTAMLLVFLSAAVGLLDFAQVNVPLTYLGPAIIGGFVLGVGFIIGGYCPGTSLVSMATLKIDGAFFVLGVVCGLFGFALSVPALWEFWNQAGFADRLTLFDLLGVDAGVVVIGVFVMAMGAFWFAEQMERLFRRDAASPSAPTPRQTRWRRAGVLAGLSIALVTAFVGQPSIAQKMAWQEKQLTQRLATREMFIDAAELLDLMHNNQLQVRMLDVRAESDFNQFHLLDARRVTLTQLESNWPSTLPATAVVVTMSNDEQAAVEAWKRLAVRGNINAYVLAGGINRWLDVYREQLPNIPAAEVAVEGPDRLRYTFSAALGERSPWARPDRKSSPQRDFVAKVKTLKPARAVGGGCG